MPDGSTLPAASAQCAVGGFSARRAAYLRHRAEAERRGFDGSEAAEIAARLAAPALFPPEEVASAELRLRLPGVGRMTPAEVVAFEAAYRADVLLHQWLPELVTLDRDTARHVWVERRRRQEWGERWTVKVDLLAGLGRGLWEEEATGAHGRDLVSLLAWLEDVTYSRALRALAHRFGVRLGR